MKKIILGEVVINITTVVMLYVIFNFAQPQQISVARISLLIGFLVGIAIFAHVLNIFKALIITTATLEAIIAYMGIIVILETLENTIAVIVVIMFMVVIMIVAMAIAFAEINFEITKEKIFAIIKISILAVALIFINYFKS